MKPIKLIYIGLLLMVYSCKTLDTNLSIPERKMPTSFSSTSTDSISIAEINWKEYFADEHLINLIDTALANNLDLQMALQRIESVRSELLFAKGSLLPNVSGSAWASQERSAEYSVDWAGNEGGTFLSGDPLKPTYNDFYLGLTSNWEVDVWGKLKNKKKAAFANYLSSIEGRNFVVSNLVADIAILYYEITALDNQLEIIQQTIQKQEEALEVINLKKEVGQANELAVQQFKAQLLDFKSWEKETLQDISLLENKINFLLGRYPQPIERNKEQIFKEIPHQISVGLPSELLSRRPDIREAEFLLQASKFDLKSAKAAFYPSFNINASVGFKAFRPEFLFKTPESITYSIVGGLVAPLINRSAIKAEFNSVKADQLSAMYNYQKAIINGYVEVANGIITLQRLQEINALKSEQNEVLTNAVEVSTEFYKIARSNYLEVLIAQQNSLQTKLELIDINKRQRIATVNIYKALGGGW